MKKFFPSIIAFSLATGIAASAAAFDYADNKDTDSRALIKSKTPLSFSMSLAPAGARDESKKRVENFVDTEFPYETVNGIAPPSAELSRINQDDKRLNLSLGADVTAGNLDAGLIYFRSRGTDGADTDEYFSYSKELDSGFEPMYILTGQFPALVKVDQAGAVEEFRQSGLEGLVVHAGYDVNNKLRIKGAFGLAKAGKETAQKNSVLSENYYGWEIDLGASYKLFDNLLYEAQFGYLNTGDYFEADISEAAPSGTYESFIYRLTHKLTMKF